MKKERVIQTLACSLLMAAGIASCGQNTQDTFTAEELQLITDGGEGVMRVLKNNLTDDSLFLRRTALPLSDKLMQTDAYDQLCRRMLTTVQAPENDGVGIAAPQVGISRRLIAVQRVDKPGAPFELYANPVIIRYDSLTKAGGEGCLSVPDRRGKVERSQEIDLQYRTPNGTDTIETIKGFAAVIFQHETDHLDGILYTDRATVMGNDYLQTRIMDDGARVTWIQDNATPRLMPRTLFPDASNALIESLGLQEGVPSTVSTFLLEREGKHILFDAGLGAKDSRLTTALYSLGVTTNDIDYIYLTHLHGDHIGGMLADGKATFARAEVYLSQAEHDGWMNMPTNKNQQQRLLMEAYKEHLHLFADGDTLPGNVTAIATHGHTPGHTVFRTGRLLIIGDILHGAALQWAHPEVCASFDMDKAAAIASRKAVLELAANEQLLIGGMHLPAPAFK